MTGKEYQEQAMRTCSIPYDKKEERLIHSLTGLASEAGECAGIWQKVYQGHPNPFESTEAKTHMIKELGDVMWMVAEACSALDVSLDVVMYLNIEKLKKRYPEGFEAGRSLVRAEGDI